MRLTMYHVPHIQSNKSGRLGAKTTSRELMWSALQVWWLTETLQSTHLAMSQQDKSNSHFRTGRRSKG